MLEKDLLQVNVHVTVGREAGMASHELLESIGELPCAGLGQREVVDDSPVLGADDVGTAGDGGAVGVVLQVRVLHQDHAVVEGSDGLTLLRGQRLFVGAGLGRASGVGLLQEHAHGASGPWQPRRLALLSADLVAVVARFLLEDPDPAVVGVEDGEEGVHGPVEVAHEHEPHCQSMGHNKQGVVILKGRAGLEPPPHEVIRRGERHHRLPKVAHTIKDIGRAFSVRPPVVEAPDAVSHAGMLVNVLHVLEIAELLLADSRVVVDFSHSVRTDFPFDDTPGLLTALERRENDREAARGAEKFLNVLGGTLGLLKTLARELKRLVWLLR
mmetsp:Transcript_19754/g.57669  ORF Transcript_19754/g.57669 Transcript_19754/m.57669 type:complete len:327 (-) Transcript_19754:247-1227(-)